MARTLSTNLSAKATQQYGAEPQTVVKIDWPTGTRYYSDKVYTFGSNVCEPKIISLGGITSQQKADAASDVASANLSLDDSDGTIKNSINRDVIPGTRCTVYQTFTGLSDTDALIVLSGRITNDISWVEGARTISFNIDTSFQLGELGYAPKRGDLSGLSFDAEGKLWPIVFGHCVKVPTVQIYKPFRTELTTVLGSTVSNIGVADTSGFLKNTTIKLLAATGNLIEGSFSTGDNIFTISDVAAAFDTNIAIAARVADADQLNPAVLWIVNNENLQDKLVFINVVGVKMINYCDGQIGKKCHFSQPWKPNNSNTLYILDSASGTLETAHNPRTSWNIVFTRISLGSDGITWTSYSTVGPGPDYGGVMPGTTISLYTNTPPTYVVANHATTIKGVYAHRTIDGINRLAQVPSSLYTKSQTTINGQIVTILTFQYQLSTWIDQGWSDEVFVTQNSSLGNNTSDVVKYLLETYTDYTVDSTTFDSVKTKITNYPSNFAILSQTDVLTLISEIVYQARLAIRYDGLTARLYYLSEIPATIQSFTDDYLRSRTLDYGFTSFDDLITKLTCKYKLDYTTEDLEYIYKNNGNTYGTKEEEKNFFIYNIASLVKLSADFWGNRLSNSWRTVKFSTFLQALQLETFDCVSLATTTLSLSPIRGEVTQASQDTQEDNITLDVKLASKSGTSSGGTIIEDTSFFTGGVTGSEAMPIDPTSGISEIDYAWYNDTAKKNEARNKLTIKFTLVPQKIVRGQTFNIAAHILEADNIIKLVNITLPLSIVESDDIDILNITSMVFINGVATATVTASNGTHDTNAVLNIIGNNDYTTAISDGIVITSEPTLQWAVDHTANERDTVFNVTFTGGKISSTYTLALNSQDPAEKLYDGTTEVTSFNTDASGNYTAAWKFKDGTFALNSVTITASHSGHNYISPEFLVIDAGGSSNLVLQATIAGAYPGDVVMSPSWAPADPANSTGKTLGVVGKVTTGDVCYIVCRGLVCITGLTAHTDYNLTSTNTLGVGDGKYVLRSYENGLCWVGGGTAIAKLTDIKDVDNTVTLAAEMIIQYSGTKWIPTRLDDSIFFVLTSVDNSLIYTHTGLHVDIALKEAKLAKIEKIADKSILANVSGSLAAPDVLTAVTIGHTLRVAADGTLGFGLIGNASINDLDWSKLTNVPVSGTHVHILTGDVTGSVSGDVAIGNAKITTLMLQTDSVTTIKILDANITNAKLLNPGLSINGVFRPLGGTDFSLGGTLAALTDVALVSSLNDEVLTYNSVAGKWINKISHPMTTAGDLIVGGVGGVPTKLGVNVSTTKKYVSSIAGVTAFVTLDVQALNDVALTTLADKDVFTYDLATTSWKNKPASGGTSTSLACICKVTAQDTLKTQVVIQIYPHGRSTEGGDITWSGIMAQVLQIGINSNKIPVNTWLIAIGTQKVPTPTTLANDATDYNWYIQPPIWM